MGRGIVYCRFHIVYWMVESLLRGYGNWVRFAYLVVGRAEIGFVSHFLAVGFWRLAVGLGELGLFRIFWLLAFGFWRLAVGLGELGSFRVIGDGEASETPAVR